MTDSPEVKLVTPAFILSVASVLITAIIGGVNVYTTHVQKRSELRAQELKYQTDLTTSRGELVFKNISLLNSQKPGEQKLAVAALIFTLGESEAEKLLASVQMFGPNDAQNLAMTAREDISIARSQRSINSKLWQGKWRFSFAGKTTMTGDLDFEFDPDGTARGEFHADSPSSTRGKITSSEFSEEGSVMKGTWSNSSNQTGKFSFRLNDSQSPTGFSGTYSMGAALPVDGSANTWSGNRK